MPIPLDSYAHCEALVRTADKDRYLAGLFAPAAARAHLYALYAFGSEIARVREAAREPMPGEIRLQWWRDVLGGQARGDVGANPVAAALIDTITECALPAERLVALIDAHAFDLYDQVMTSLDELDGYAVRTAGALFEVGGEILGGAGNTTAITAAAVPAGIAFGVAHRLRTFARDTARRQMFVPIDLLTQHGVAREEIEARQNTTGMRAALAALREHARGAYAQFRSAAAALPESCAPAFLPVALVPPLLARLDKSVADPFAEIEVPQWRRQWALWRAARRWPRL